MGSIVVLDAKIIKDVLRGGFKYFFIFTPNLGEMIKFDEYFSNGLKPPTSKLHENFDFL